MATSFLVERFVNSALVIDDKPDEVKDILSELKSHDIATVFLTPEECRDRKFTRLRQLLFLDLMLDDSRKEIENISAIRKYLQNLFPVNLKGPYGLVLWTKHLNNIELFREKLSEDRRSHKYNTPLFVVGLDKMKYKERQYAEMFSDLEHIIQDDKAANFFIQWTISVYEAAGDSINDIYSLVPEYSKQNTELQYLLYRLAQNHTGVPKEFLMSNPSYNLAADAYKAFDELMYSDLINQLPFNSDSLFTALPIENPWKGNFEEAIKVFSRLNAKAFIDIVNVNQSLVVPGNVYELNGTTVPSSCSFPKKSHRIMIELTPPCDFSHKKIYSRCVYGFMIDCPMELAQLEKKMDDLKGDYRYFLWPVEIQDKARILCFDFRCLASFSDNEIAGGKFCKTLFKANPRLLADILQKFSSHAARLGLSSIEPELPKKRKRCDEK